MKRILSLRKKWAYFNLFCLWTTF